MSTPQSSSASYATPDDLVLHHDVRQIGDFIVDIDSTGGNRSRATPAQVLASPIVQEHLDAAAGLIESACQRGGKYSPTDLDTTLTGVSKRLLVKLNCELAFWSLYRRRNASAPIAPGEAFAFDTLVMLEKGERVFGLAENIDAGKPKNGFMNQGDWQTLGLASDSVQGRHFLGRRQKIRRGLP